MSDTFSLRFVDFQNLDGNMLHLKEKKTGKTRTILLTARALEIVAERQAANSGHEYLFQVESNRAKGKPISRVTVSTKFKEAGDRLGLHVAAHTPRKNLGYRSEAWCVIAHTHKVIRSFKSVNHAGLCGDHGKRYSGRIHGDRLLKLVNEFGLPNHVVT
ncbi:tyrosine-type recombinase/integrase [Citrobacter amalonaticus]|uniref:tyrosine-type recombinase/integrase n=1 Tax=Citrobacter amalonaticus TaxID=35703 RepID=UPI00221F8316|nr:tyrosine-type recombinase/integrase [Citrobacter amalonaticus]